VGLIELIHWVLLKGPLTTTSLLVISNTNLQESIEFIDLKASLELFILIPYLFLFIVSAKYKPQYISSKAKPYIISLVLIISIGFIMESAVHGKLIRTGLPQIAKVTFSFINEIELYKEVFADRTPKTVNAKSSNNINSETVILIIGESCNRNHMSLYNSKRETNPRLTKRKDIFVFNNVVSPYSNTISSVLSILSEANLENSMPFNKSIDIIDIFHSAKFKTYWISNQSPVGIWENLVTIFAKKSDHYEFVNTTSNTSFEATLNTSYDSKILEPFESALNEDINKKFIILHLLGNHSSYAKRYPSEFDYFKGKNDREETIAEYDNSVLYNDYILDSLINIAEKKKNESITLVYLSDHGENVYDEFDKVGHDFSYELPKSNVEIPFFVWLSKRYIELHFIKTNNIKANVNLPFVSDNLFHSLIDLNGIESPFLNETKSIFNKNFDATRKRILEDGKNYDEK